MEQPQKVPVRSRKVPLYTRVVLSGPHLQNAANPLTKTPNVAITSSQLCAFCSPDRRKESAKLVLSRCHLNYAKANLAHPVICVIQPCICRHSYRPVQE